MALSQIEKITKVLQALKKDITTEDRKEYYKQSFGRNSVTTTRYLNGNVTDVQTGMDMLNFFSNRIAERNRKIEELQLQTA